MSQGREGTTLAAFSVGAVGSVAPAALLKGHPPGGAERWTRKNHAGRAVTLFEGPAYAVGAVAGALAGGAGAPAAVAGLGAGAFGALDDLVGDSSSKGLRGHLAAARRGEVTTGAIKIVGLGATGLLTAWIVDRSRMRTGPAMATLVGGAVIAGSANIANLLDLRPGRALKVVLLLAVPLVAGGRGPTRPPPGPAPQPVPRRARRSAHCPMTWRAGACSGTRGPTALVPCSEPLWWRAQVCVADFSRSRW